MEQHTHDENFLVDKRQRHLSLIHLYLDGNIDSSSFQRTLRSEWAEEREAIWNAAQHPSCCDFRPFARLLDRLDCICVSGSDPDDLRCQVRDLLAACRAATAGDPASALSHPPNRPLFERPLPKGWIYPCTVEDIRQQLARAPEQDLEGLVAVGLAPPERVDRGCYGTYWYAHWRNRMPVIYLYAQPASLSFKRRHFTVGQMERRCASQVSYGMRIEREASHIVCRWEPECLRWYIAEHVLLHEIGHHVQRRQRERLGLSPFPGHRACEQFAEDYALKKVRERNGRQGRRW